MNPKNGQVKPATNVQVVAYKSIYYKNSLINSIFVTEQGDVDSTFKISVVPPYQIEEARHYLFFDTPICGNQVIQIDPFLQITSNTEVRVSSSTGTVSFTVSALEVP